MTHAKTVTGRRAAAPSATGITVTTATPGADTPAKPRPASKTRARPLAEALDGPKARPVVEPDGAKPKPKLVRDSFTIPKAEYAVLDALKLRATRLMRPTKKSEVLRAGIAALQAMDDDAFLAAVERVPSLKTGRPKSRPEPASLRPAARKAAAT